MTATFPTLYDVILPGTHDSAAYATRPDLTSRASLLPLSFRPIRRACASVQTDFALTQNLSILDQLRAGARFLDIRVSKRPATSADSSFWTVHGMVLCVPLADVIHQINQFHMDTDDDPQVVVTVFRPSLLDNDERDQLSNFVFNSFLHPCFDGDGDDLRTIPLRLLKRNVVAGLTGSRLTVGWGRDAWLNTNSPDRKICFLKDTIAATKNRQFRNDLFVLGWTVTPSVMDVTLRILSLGTMRPSVRAEALKMNTRFDQFLKDHQQPMKNRVNVVFFDCFSAKLARQVNNISVPSSDNDDSTVS